MKLLIRRMLMGMDTWSRKLWLRSRTVVSEGREGKVVRFRPEQSTLTV